MRFIEVGGFHRYKFAYSQILVLVRPCRDRPGFQVLNYDHSHGAD